MPDCEDKPCCSHGTEPCDPQWYDRPGAFDTSVPGNEHALCDHEEEGCLLDLESDDEDEPDDEDMFQDPTSVLGVALRYVRGELE